MNWVLAEGFISVCTHLLHSENVTIINVYMIVGKLIAAAPGNEMNPIVFKRMEHFKNKCLKINKGHYDVFITLSKETIEDVH